MVKGTDTTIQGGTEAEVGLMVGTLMNAGTTLTCNIHPGSQYFPLPTSTSTSTQEGGEEDSAEETTHNGEGASSSPTSLLNPSTLPQLSLPQTRARNLLALLIQPPDYPPNTPEKRNLIRGADLKAGAGPGPSPEVGPLLNIPLEAGAVVRIRAEEDATREYRRRQPSQDEDIRTWHSLSARPERFYPSQLPRLALNYYMRKLVHDAPFAFNPLLFCLYDQHGAAIQKRDSWITSSWPLAKEPTRPLSQDPLELERVAVQEGHRQNINRLEGSLEALCSGDEETVAGHLFDALLVQIHEYADMEARR
jgi:hypothetical protein